MMFPTEMLIDYVRVYQRDGYTNIGCDPPGYPTKSYIDAHLEAYTSKELSFCVSRLIDVYIDPNYTAWPYAKPQNSQYDGC